MPKSVVNDSDFPSWEEWQRDMLDDFDPANGEDLSWHALGDWLYSCKSNDCYAAQSMVYHVCKKNYNRLFATELGRGEGHYADSISGVEAGCAICKAQVPDGWKMIMMLEKL
jgi:hypothetical protein